MGHLDDDNLQRFTISIRFPYGDATAQVFNGCVEPDADNDHLVFKDRHGKTQEFHGVSYQIAEE